MSPFEARYRRLPACYPRDHRVLSVLLTGARPGETCPHPADAADLLWGVPAASLLAGRRTAPAT